MTRMAWSRLQSQALSLRQRIDAGDYRLRQSRAQPPTVPTIPRGGATKRLSAFTPELPDGGRAIADISCKSKSP